MSRCLCVCVTISCWKCSVTEVENSSPSWSGSADDCIESLKIALEKCLFFVEMLKFDQISALFYTLYNLFAYLIYRNILICFVFRQEELDTFIHVIGDNNAKINDKKIAPGDFEAFPSFNRFRRISLPYFFGRLPISKKCYLFSNHLQKLKPFLNDPIMIVFWGNIDENNPHDFSSHSTLLNHLRNELLPACNTPHYYFFSITHYDWQANSGTSIMSSILQIPQITRCPGLKLDIDVTQLPVREISNWLHGTSDDAKGNNGQENSERLLTIFSRSIQNIEEMCCALKKVLFYF